MQHAINSATYIETPGEESAFTVANDRLYYNPESMNDWFGGDGYPFELVGLTVPGQIRLYHQVSNHGEHDPSLCDTYDDLSSALNDLAHCGFPETALLVVISIPNTFANQGHGDGKKKVITTLFYCDTAAAQPRFNAE